MSSPFGSFQGKDPGNISPHPQEAILSRERALDPSQHERFNILLQKNVHIHSKDRKIHVAQPAYKVLEALVSKCINIFNYAQGNPLYPTNLNEMQNRFSQTHHAITVRGSTNSALLLNESLEADLDVVLKFAICPTFFQSDSAQTRQAMRTFFLL